MNLIHVYTAGSTLQAGESSHDSWLQRMVLRAAHPVSIVFSIIGWTWGVFYLWRHDWVMALIAVVLARASVHLQEVADTILGRLALLHLQPFNLTIQVIGTVVLITGVWMHGTELILGGISLITVGHAFGWSHVHPGLALEESLKKP